MHGNGHVIGEGHTTTRLVAAGRKPEAHYGVVNTPVFRASTVLFPTADDWLKAQEAKKAGVRGVYYGRTGTPTSHDLEDALCELEQGYRTFLFPSGLSAIFNAMVAFVPPRSRLLVSKNAYAPSKSAAEHLRQELALDVRLFDPMRVDEFRDVVGEGASLVVLESPGSNTFEVSDVDTISAIAHDAGATVAMDNTWATPLLFKPLAHGVDLSIQALTKYVSGHSDMLGGTVTVTEAAHPKMKRHYDISGCCLASDECYSASRGLRTLAVRLRQHEANGLSVARWLADRRDVARVNHPALPECPGHAYWRENFAGASGLFSIEFDNWGWPETRRFLNALKLFGIGASWGGYESLALPAGPPEGEVKAGGGRVARVRLHVGLESPADLIADIEGALGLVNEARK